MSSGTPKILNGQARERGGPLVPATVTLDPAGFSVAAGGGAPWQVAYRDLATIADTDLTLEIGIGSDGAGAETWSFERFGPGLTNLTQGLRGGRFRQWLTDGLVDIAADAPIETVDLATDTDPARALVAYHDRGVAIAPFDETLPRHRIRRADIETASADPERGGLLVETDRGPLELVRLGNLVTSHQQRWLALRDTAATDASAIVGALLADAPFDVRRQASTHLREGRPVDSTQLGEAWPAIERAVLVEPTFEASYQGLVDAAGGPGSAPRWLAIAPERPGATDRPKLWFLVGLPGNLLALELVSEGAHATYLFRVAPRATASAGIADGQALGVAVREVSDALLDSRFLREPMALTEARLAEPDNLRYRLALRVLPSLAAARARFVARLVHRDQAGWAAALQDLIAWHGTARDEAAEWPGRAGEEASIEGQPAADAGGAAGPI